MEMKLKRETERKKCGIDVSFGVVKVRVGSSRLILFSGDGLNKLKDLSGKNNVKFRVRVF